MRYLILILLTCSLTVSWAQSDLTRADVFEAGDIVEYFAVDATNADPGPAGLGVTWDFSNLPRTPADDFIVEYADPSKAPNAADFPAANLVAIQDAGATTAYTFFTVYDDYFELIGLDLPEVGVVTYSDINLWLNFPLSYNESQTDPFAGNYIFNVQGISGITDRTGELTTLYDGYGTIILPNGDRIENVRRLKLTQTVKDVINVMGFSITTQVDTITYNFWAEDTHTQVFQITYADSTVTPPGTTVKSVVASYRLPEGDVNPGPTTASRRGAHLTSPNGGFDSEIIIRNPTDSAQTLNLLPYDGNGTGLSAVEVILGPQTTTRVLQQDYFPTDATSFSASGCADCTFSIGYRSVMPNSSTAQVHQSQDFQNIYYFYPGEWDALFDGAALVNAGEANANIQATQYADNGQMIASATLATNLEPGAKQLVLFNDILMDNPDSMVKIESDQPLAAMILRISHDNRFLYQNQPLPEPAAQGSERWLAHVTSDTGGFMTDILIHNNGNASETVMLHPYSADGTAMATVNQTVPAGQTFRYAKADLFQSETSHFGVSGGANCTVSTGYRANIENGSTAITHESAPIGTEFYVYPGEWDVLYDGVALINTGNANATITLTQIGDDGVAGQPVTLAENLPAKAKYLGLFEGLIPEDSNTIIKVESNQPLAILALRLSKDGRYLYNNNPL